jgi:amino acid transporter
MGPAGAVLLALGAVISITGTLGTIVLAAPRLPFAMAEAGDLPPVLASTHPRFRTPWPAILVTAAIMLALALNTTFIGALTIGTAIRLLTYVSTCTALLVLRRRRDVPEAAFRMPFATPLVIVALLTCVWLITSVTWREGMMVAIAALPGLLLALFMRRPGQASGPPPSPART